MIDVGKMYELKMINKRIEVACKKIRSCVDADQAELIKRQGYKFLNQTKEAKSTNLISRKFFRKKLVNAMIEGGFRDCRYNKDCISQRYGYAKRYEQIFY